MLRIKVDDSKVFIYVDSRLVWEGTLEDWSFQISHPMTTPHVPNVDNRIIKLDLIRLVYTNCVNAAEALLEAQKLYDFVISDNSTTSED